MRDKFINIIKDASKVYLECKEHPAIKYEIISVIAEALEKMDEEEMIKFDKWIASKEILKELTQEERETVNIIKEFIEE